jgi:hypothetical protein
MRIYLVTKNICNLPKCFWTQFQWNVPVLNRCDNAAAGIWDSLGNIFSKLLQFTAWIEKRAINFKTSSTDFYVSNKSVDILWILNGKTFGEVNAIWAVALQYENYRRV